MKTASAFNPFQKLTTKCEAHFFYNCTLKELEKDKSKIINYSSTAYGWDNNQTAGKGI